MGRLGSLAEVAGFGALNVDKLFLVDRIPARDEEGFVIDVKIAPGGSAANTIVGLSRLGVKTVFVGKVGSDSEGEFLLCDLRNEGVDVSSVKVSEGRSGCAMVFVDPSGHRAILVDPGVNDEVDFEEINVEALSAEAIHMTSFVCKSSDKPFEAQKKLATFFDTVSLDPGTLYAERADVWELISKTTIFLPSVAEIEKITGADYRRGAEKVMAHGVKIVAVKLGEKGCYVTDGRKEFHIPALKVSVADTTGAGDAFNAGFLYAYLRGYDLDVCGVAGNYVAAKCVEKLGARDGLPSERDVEEYLSGL
ncbi:carbohydrate kinase family protein [Archaeoglobus veneficus]|uniref:PfkB domain protein n=1 Tax=Archaeoglobus veneficus (strain DSM 11195 / SNP6) TaxID=693661 RepID=F2KRB1_ARCVS|nr:carbohydrate kinase family protein [Archaeoglobus veneficus]AEA47845.1 PfkB domain protein [Archaeoglobus veneficus SNP6]